MKLISAFLVYIILLIPWSLFERNHHQPNEENLYPFTLFLKGKPMDWKGASIPYIFIEFNSSDDVNGYLAYYGKTRGFNCFWKFKLLKHDTIYLSDSMLSCFEKKPTYPVSVTKIKGDWIVYIPEDKTKYEVSFLPTNHEDVNRNYVYSLATFNELYAQQENKKDWHYELSNKKDKYFKYEEELLLNGKFEDIKKHIDSLNIDELANLLHINNY